MTMMLRCKRSWHQRNRDWDPRLFSSCDRVGNPIQIFANKQTTNDVQQICKQNGVSCLKNWNPVDILGVLEWFGYDFKQWENSALKANAQSGEARQTHLPRESLGGRCVPLLRGTKKGNIFFLLKDFACRFWRILIAHCWFMLISMIPLSKAPTKCKQSSTTYKQKRKPLCEDVRKLPSL